MGGRGASSIKIRTGLSRITDKDTPNTDGLEIERETEKAVLLKIRNTVFSGYSYNRRSDDIQSNTSSESIWLPKSQIQTYKNRVIAIPDWLGKRYGIHTETYKRKK